MWTKANERGEATNAAKQNSARREYTQTNSQQQLDISFSQ